MIRFFKMATSKRSQLYRTFLSSVLFFQASHFAVARQNTTDDPSLARIQKSGVLRVCSDAGFLPFEMRTSSGGWTGFDVDMMNDFSKSLDVRLEMVQISFDGIIPALLAGKCDLIAAGMTVTPDRQKVVVFSNTTYENGISVAMKNTATNKEKYKDLKSLDQNGIRIAVKTGYTSDIYLTKTLKHAQIMRFDQDSDLLLAVTQGRADAFASDTTYVKLTNKANQDKFLVLPTAITTEKFSIAGKKQDKILMEKFNSFLKKWKHDGNDKKAEAKYFEKL